jgi:ribonuclease Z
MSTVVVSHGHTDHLGGLAYWASQRWLNSLGPGTLVAPEPICRDLQVVLDAHARLEGGEPYPVKVEAVADGCSHQLRRDVSLRFFATDHWIRTLGTQVLWFKHRLRSELAHLDGEEIAARRRAGEEVSVREQVPVLAYGADSGPGLLEQQTAVLASEVLLLECSFFKPGDHERARRFGHTHIDDLVAAAPTLGCRHLVLLHASRRHRLREVEALVDEHLRPLLACQLHHLNVDWD